MIDDWFEPFGESTGTSPARKEYRPEVVKELKPSEPVSDPLFRLLAEPALPTLGKRDRAKLQMQSPNRIHFYWSVKENPFKTLQKALPGSSGSYTLVSKLRNLSSGTEEIHPVDAKGDWWYSVDSNTRYQAEIGLFATNRPYIRIAFSNELRTPRKTPSERTDYTPSFVSSAGDFALALDAAGYKRDAFDVAMKGDDPKASWTATAAAYKRLTGIILEKSSDVLERDLRFVMMALAAGYELDEIEKHIDPATFELIKRDLQGASRENAFAALEENFDVIADEFDEIEEIGEAVFGASLVNFPRSLRRRKMPRSLLPKLDEVTGVSPVTSPAKP